MARSQKTVTYKMKNRGLKLNKDHIDGWNGANSAGNVTTIHSSEVMHIYPI